VTGKNFLKVNVSGIISADFSDFEFKVYLCHLIFKTLPKLFGSIRFFGLNRFLFLDF